MATAKATKKLKPFYFHCRYIICSPDMLHPRIRKAVAAATALCLIAGGVAPAMSASLIRDAEVENTLRGFASPIFTTAGIEPDTVRVFIINDRSINAFVAGGLNIFIHTGLILESNTPEMLMGVLAHETGHIAGAHLSQLSSANNDASIGALISYVLGGAAILAGSGDAGAAIMTAGQNTSLRNLLSHYRGNEQQADQAAIRYLEALNIPPGGMLSMFEVLRRKEQQHMGNSDPYLRTHPLTSERIAVMRGAIEKSTVPANALPAGTNLEHQRMVAKLYAFLETPQKTLARYPASDTSVPAQMARAIAYFRMPDIEKSLQVMNALIKQVPNDPFLLDLKGQILFENGRIDEAISAYKAAADLLPYNGLLLTDLGKAYLANENPANLHLATSVLERAARADDSNHQTYRQLAVAYGKQGNLGESYLALAREAALLNNPKDTLIYARQALSDLKPDSPSALQAEDLINEAKELVKGGRKS